MLKRKLDQEARDMAATLVYALRGIEATIEQSTLAWEKRNYYLKADRYRREWEWVAVFAKRLGRIVQEDAWDQLPSELAQLAPYFKDIRVVAFTRDASAWQSNYTTLRSELEAESKSL